MKGDAGGDRDWAMAQRELPAFDLERRGGVASDHPDLGDDLAAVFSSSDGSVRNRSSWTIAGGALA